MMNESNKFIQSAFKKKINLEIRNGKQSDGFSGIVFSAISAALPVLSSSKGVRNIFFSRKARKER